MASVALAGALAIIRNFFATLHVFRCHTHASSCRSAIQKTQAMAFWQMRAMWMRLR
jgi:hypothetical protein